MIYDLLNTLIWYDYIRREPVCQGFRWALFQQMRGISTKRLTFSVRAYIMLFACFEPFGLPDVLWRGIEAVITGLTRNQFARKRTGVRIPPSPPEATWFWVMWLKFLRFSDYVAHKFHDYQRYYWILSQIARDVFRLSYHPYFNITSNPEILTYTNTRQRRRCPSPLAFSRYLFYYFMVIS